ncbi:hypothetical protein GA0115252_16344 [Streptomyces sp. DfronAA-171]|nr:hypothetical protein GA0115252_16344 [Streptomyces sp. DfronAA-171]
MATSGTNSPTRTMRPITSAVTIVSPRLHQVRPTSEEKPLAMSTPAMTALTRRMPVLIVAKRVTCTTRSAVSGAVRGAGCGRRVTARTYEMTAADVERSVWVTTGSTLLRARSFTGAGALRARAVTGAGTSGIASSWPRGREGTARRAGPGR